MAKTYKGGYLKQYEILPPEGNLIAHLDEFKIKYGLTKGMKLIVYAIDLSYIKKVMDEHAKVVLSNSKYDICLETNYFQFRSGIALGLQNNEQIYNFIENWLSLGRGHHLMNIPRTLQTIVKKKYSTACQRKVTDDTKLTFSAWEVLSNLSYAGLQGYNPKYLNKITKGVTSYDITSCHPAIIKHCKLPTYDFQPVDKKTFEEKRKEVNQATLARYIIKGIRLKDGIPFGLRSLVTIPNKKINITRYFLDVDIQTIELLYDYDSIEIDYSAQAFIAPLSHMNKGIVNVMESYYKEKELYHTPESKVALNCLYGFFASNPLKNEEIKTQEQLDKKYNYRHGRFTVYSIGAYIVAISRLRLARLINKLKDDVVYADTDSIKFKGDWGKLFNHLNLANGFTEGCMGYWKKEGYYSDFKSLGVKTYAYICEGEFTARVAGLKDTSMLQSMSDFIAGRVVYYENKSFTLGQFSFE